MGLRSAAVGVLATTLLVSSGQGSQTKGTKELTLESPVAVPVRELGGDKEAKTALQNFTDFLKEVKKNNNGVLIILEVPEITMKNLPAAEAAFNAITDPKNGMNPGKKINLGGDFTAQEEVRALFFVRNFGRQLSTVQNALGTDEGSTKAEQTRKTADSYNVKGDPGVSVAFGTQVPLSALQSTEKSSK